MRKILFSAAFLSAALSAQAQTIRLLPDMSPSGGSHNDQATVSCTFPEGCSGGKYWIDGGELQALDYTGPFTVDYSCRISVAGVNAEGRIITDVVSNDFDIRRVTPPYTTATPKEGTFRDKFNATRIQWNNVTRTDLILDEFKAGHKRYGEPVVWVTDETQNVVASNDYTGLWSDGINAYKAYIYKDYEIEKPGHYVLHIASGVFRLDGKMYEEEVRLNYSVADKSAPLFTPEEGEYVGPLTLTINYPNDGTAFYKFYKLNGGKAKQYTQPITLTETTTVEAYGMDQDFTAQTATSKATYVITPAEEPKTPLTAPTMTYENGKVNISGPEGTVLKYWMDDRMATAQHYTAPFAPDHNGRISCVAYTSDNTSTTVNIDITDFAEEPSEQGNMLLQTPATLETVHVHGISPNGRFATGFTGEATSSRSFVWDLSSDKFQTPSSVFISQLYGISDDGIAYGWRARTADIDEQTKDEDLLWGTCKDGVWTEHPQGFKAGGITSGGIVYGTHDDRPACYDIPTQTIVYYEGEEAGCKGAITTASGKRGLLGGYIVKDGHRIPALWQQDGSLSTISTPKGEEAEITALSANGEWAVIGQQYRVKIAQDGTVGAPEYLISMSERSHNTMRPEILTAIADDGTLFGTYDASLCSPERGIALVYTPDRRWRTLADWLRDERSYEAKNLALTSVRALSADQHVILCHAMQSGADASDAFTRGLAIMNDVTVKHLAPTAVTTEVMGGLTTIKVSWNAPLTDADRVQSYTVKRDGTPLATCDAQTFNYYDNTVEAGKAYEYTVSAIYADGTASPDSYSSTVTYTNEGHAAVRNLAARQMGLDDMMLTWDAPIISMPKLQYFDERSEWLAWGTGTLDAEFGIRIPAADLQNYKGQQIRAFQFLPTGQQTAYTMNLYRGNADGNGYEDEPYYSQAIDPKTLHYGTVNVVPLTSPQPLPETDLYVTLFIESAGTDDMLGVSFEGFKSGYSDLCRIDGVHEKMVVISKESQQTTNITLPLGVSVCSEEEYKNSLVERYDVTLDGNSVASVTKPRTKLEDMAEGLHTLGVTTIYSDGQASAEVTLPFNMQQNEEAYVAAPDVKVKVQADNTALVTWSAPLEDDRTDIQWGNQDPVTGWEVPEGFNTFAAAAVYPATLTSQYGEDYEITDVFYCPMEEIYYAITLDDGQGNVLAQFVPATPDENQAPLPMPYIGEVNYVHLPKPVSLNPSLSYQLTVNVYGAEPGMTPLAWDTSGKWNNGFSNLIDYGYGPTTLSDLVQNGQYPNWIMGFVVREKNAKPMPLAGYNVRIDGKKANTSLLTTTSFTTSALADGTHRAAVDAVYDAQHTVNGQNVSFSVPDDAEGIGTITVSQPNDQDAATYDLTGRRVITDHNGRGLFIIGNGKTIK